MARRAVRVVENFAPEIRAARAVFDQRFADPRKANGDRFVWDWWHVPGQYTQLRTPAWQYFPAPLYRALHRKLVDWGRRQLGCHDVSPPWLSLYVDGCGQELHGDLPHGPFAFVLSLTRWTGRRFTGGETVMLRDDVLDYWTEFVSERSVERDDLIRAIEPKFGRLVVFDPRIPHGVRRVAGTVDPREGRLVINGWFVQPRPFIVGPLPAAAVTARIDDLTDAIARWNRIGVWLAGTVAVRIRVRADGAVAAADVLTDTTRAPQGEEREGREIIRTVRRVIRGWKFPRRRAPSTITLPLVFTIG
jgi:hypothetical protein